MADGKIKPEDLNQDLITQTYNDLAKGAANGVGSSWTSFENKGVDKLVVEMRRNLYTFASAKSYAQLQTLNQALYTQDGKIRPFNEFSQIVRKINNNYNKNWLQAEYQTARTAGQMAMKWQRIQQDKDLFPNLRYRTVGDDRVRDEHEILNGIIKPVDDPFWATKYPPLAWRCRCDVVQTAEKVTNEKLEDLPKSDFDGNVGMDGEIFTKNLKFFKLLNTDSNALRNAELAKLNAPFLTPEDDRKESEKEGKYFERYYINEKTGKSVKTNLFYDKTDFDANFEAAKILVNDLGINVEIRAHLNGKVVKYFKNPEYLLNKSLADLKTPKSKNYSNILSKANEQGCEIVVVSLQKNNDSFQNAESSINNILKFNNVHNNIKEVIIINRQGEILIYKRKKGNQK